MSLNPALFTGPPTDAVPTEGTHDAVPPQLLTVDLSKTKNPGDEGFVVLDRDWRVRFANAALAGLVGCKPGDLLGKHLWPELPDAIGSALRLHCERAVETQHSVACEGHLDLQTTPLSIRVHPSPDGVTIIFRNESRLVALLAERRAFLDRLVDVEDRERARIAADVHDDSVQAMVVVSLRLELLRARMSDPSREVKELFDGLAEQVTVATRRLRALLFSLEPSDTDVRIAQSIRSHAAQIFDGSGVHWSVDDIDAGEELPRAERSQALRITKEALNNAQSHAQASEVIVTIEGTADGVEIVVTDDGVGGDPAFFTSAPGHRGLATMRDRAAVAGGLCSFEAASGNGCTVRIFMPRGDRSPSTPHACSSADREGRR